MRELGTSEAIINKITTVVDGGLRVTLDLPADDFELVKKLLEKKSKGDPLIYVAFVEKE